MLLALNIPMRTKTLPYGPLAALIRLNERMARMMRKEQEPKLTEYGLSVLAFSRTLSIDRAATELGFRPRATIEDCLQDMARWWRDNACNA